MTKRVYRATMAIQAFAGQHHLAVDKYKIRLASSYGDGLVEIAAYEHDFGVDPQNDCPPIVAEAVRKFGVLHPLADPSLLNEWSRAEAAILIGQDYLNTVMPLQPPEPVCGELQGFRTVFGWALGGAAKNTSVQATVMAIQVACCKTTLSSPVKTLRELWKLDAIGIHERAQNSIAVDGGRGWPQTVLRRSEPRRSAIRRGSVVAPSARACSRITEVPAIPSRDHEIC